MLGNVISRVRYIGLAEGISFILLLFIAMPLKYWADMPEAVTIVGGLHGLLFVLYLAAIAHVTLVKRWTITRVAAAVASAFVPFGPFLLDRKLKHEV